MRARFPVVVAFAGALGLACPATSALEVERDEEFARAHPAATALVLSERTTLDISYDPRADGVVGEWTVEVVYWIRSRPGIDLVNRHPRWSSPHLAAESFEVEIVPLQGGSRRLDSGKLTWIPFSDAGDGVYSLDTEAAYTVIDGLHEGDLLRVRSRSRLRGVHGVPSVSMGCSRDLPVRASELIVRFPGDHTLIHEWTGTDELIDRIVTEKAEIKRKTQLRFTLGETAPSGYEILGAYTPTDQARFTAHFSEVGRPIEASAFAAGSSWESVGSGYAQRIEEAFRADQGIEEHARALTLERSDPRARIEAIYEDVQRRCRYLGLFDGLGGILPEPATVTAAREFGDCKGLSTLLIALLRSAGVQAHPVLVRTRSAGPLAITVPNLAQFNHFIVWADDGLDGVWLDPTYDFCPAGLVPTANAAWPVLRLGPGAPSLVAIDGESADPGSLNVTLQGSLASDGSLELETVELATGNHALQRRMLTTDPSTTPDRLARALLDRALLTGQFEAGSEPTAWQLPTEVRARVRTRRGATVAGSQLFLSRRLANFDLPALEKERRVTALDLRGLGGRLEEWRIELPAGASVRPDSAEVAVEGLRWSCRIWQERSTLRLRRTLAFDPIRLEPGPALVLAREVERIAKAEDSYVVIDLGSGR